MTPDLVCRPFHRTRTQSGRDMVKLFDQGKAHTVFRGNRWRCGRLRRQVCMVGSVRTVTKYINRQVGSIQKYRALSLSFHFFINKKLQKVCVFSPKERNPIV